MKAESEFFPTSILFLSGPDVGANNRTDDQLRMGEQQLRLNQPMTLAFRRTYL
jgi:hypothetical protein